MNEHGSSLIPSLCYEDATAAIEWLKEAFGFKALLVVPGEGRAVIHSQLQSPEGNGMIMVFTNRNDPDGLRPPAVDGGASQALYLVITDVEAHYARAKAAGATIVLEPVAQEDRGLLYTCRDPEGHTWNFGEYNPWDGPQSATP
jgi:uncharacterized glyoxalase superfamily protein PhnB